ncbi:proliferating cell nuclear antigen [Klosneuvirus KNV1]|uniref:Proliferating cell nuclear antigen n=1 Tax=Klosneuvirus KNV1 TaxID=1977640 RepID=A0A1V0SI61_9VIRU|nr:proliferating cell nuclear antigen [Klosneuvirus KNV1]
MKILNVVTEHTLPFKTLFEVLKEMLTEANIVFKSSIKKKDDDEDVPEESDKKSEKNTKEEDCMEITALDPTKTILIRVKLNGSDFSTWECKKNKLVFGINLGYFYKILKSMDKNAILSMSMDHDTKNCLKISMENQNEKKTKTWDFKLLDLDESKINIPKIDFDAMITMDSQEFNRLCKEMSGFADYVEITCLHNKLIFQCKGDYANCKTVYGTADSEDDETENILVSISHASTQSKNSNAPQIVQGIFELKKLVLFSKCATLCNEIEIYMKNDFPLVIKYTIATLGKVLLCLTPIKEDTTKNATYSDEDEYYSDDDN